MALKGHAKIELKDVNTGEVTVQESDNMFTNALQYLTNYFVKGFADSYVNIRNFLVPYTTYGLRGIILFEDAIEEDAENWHLPAGNLITGYCGDNTDKSTDTYRGIYNQNESEGLDNGYKYVWDFGTDEANGQISCVALTNNWIQYGLAMDYRGSSGVEWSLGYRGTNIISVTDKDEMVVAKTSTSSGVTTAIFTIIPMSKSVIHLKDSYGYNYTTITTTDLPRKYLFRDGEDGYYYGFQYTGSGMFYVCRISAETFAYDTEYGEHAITLSVTFSSCNTALLGDGYIYICGDSAVIKMSLSDFTEVATYNYAIGTNSCYYNGWIWSSYGVIDCNFEHVSWYPSTNKLSRNMYIKNGIVYYLYYYSSSYYYGRTLLPTYLATINNITPVVKTSAQTMKITYTVTEE